MSVSFMNSFGPFSNSFESFVNILIFWGIVLKCLGIVLNCLGAVLRLLGTALGILWIALGSSQRHQIKRPRQPLNYPWLSIIGWMTKTPYTIIFGPWHIVIIWLHGCKMLEAITFAMQPVVCKWDDWHWRGWCAVMPHRNDGCIEFYHYNCHWRLAGIITPVLCRL